jgi:hypothetical protein
MPVKDIEVVGDCFNVDLFIVLCLDIVFLLSQDIGKELLVRE